MDCCTLCNATDVYLYSQIDKRKYYRCQNCKFIYLDSKDRLSPNDEKNRYDLHNNNPLDKQYREFLARLYEPIYKKIKIGDKGLDYGCGPGPALAAMFNEQGFTVDLYDPFYFPDKSHLSKKYNFITCSEVAEHFYKPAKEFGEIDKVLVKGGWFGMMTNLYDDSTSFESWYYRKDPTHVSFYSKETLHKIASIMSWNIEELNHNVVLFQK